MTQQPMVFSNARGRDKEVARLQAEVAAGAPKLQELSQQIDQLVASGDQGLQSQVLWQSGGWVGGSVGGWGAELIGDAINRPCSHVSVCGFLRLRRTQVEGQC